MIRIRCLAPASRAFAVLRKPLVVSLLQRVGNRAVIGHVPLRHAVALQRALVEGLLQGVRYRTIFGHVVSRAPVGLQSTLVERLLQRVGYGTTLACFTAVATRRSFGAGSTIGPLAAIGPGAARAIAVAPWRRCALGAAFGAAFGTAFGAAMARPAIWRAIGDALGAFAPAPAPAAIASSLAAACRCALRLAWRARHGLGRTRAAGQPAQVAQILVGQINPDSPLQPLGQHHRPVANADQTAHGVADSLEQAAHLPVTALGDDDAIPMVDPFAATIVDAFEGRPLAIDLHAFQQARLGFGLQHAQRAHRVFTFDAKAWVHQLVGQLAGGREQQQTLGVDIQPPD